VFHHQVTAGIGSAAEGVVFNETQCILLMILNYFYCYSCWV